MSTGDPEGPQTSGETPADAPEPEPEPEPAGPKVTPIFQSPAERSTVAVLERTAAGYPRSVVECESPEAAVHWDTDRWYPVSKG